jgi:hypothetical protein
LLEKINDKLAWLNLEPFDAMFFNPNKPNWNLTIKGKSYRSIGVMGGY